MDKLTTQSERDIYYMRLALREAEKGFAKTSPNPMVGAVIVKNEKIIGRGFHRKSGMPHAEVEAINNCRDSLEGSTLYCTLEPCCHSSKKTPPCVPSIINSKIKKVVIANFDVNPEVKGKGVDLLRSAGIEVVTDVLRDECLRLNETFFYHIVNKKPFVHLKAAISIDGKICTKSGDSKWITNEESRKESHLLRMTYDAVLIGRNTLNEDDPKLNIRMGIENKNKIPSRIILGNPLKFNWNSYLLNNNLDLNIYAVQASNYENLDEDKKEILQKGKIIFFESLKKMQESLYELGIYSYLVEGGSEVLSSFLKENIYNKITLFQAPILVGNGKSFFNSDANTISEAIKFDYKKIENVNGNLKIELGL
ncbi:MAG: diaminohydroxyphosphoribosylaminopyrimidine deaminase [Bacteriovoracaceae bacterium]|jgi:diaminohydroxyphosphoribosylaminopyrimidine deaminase/5-amino-6-(5-phosphoribosylamino)uracil reductase